MHGAEYILRNKDGSIATFYKWVVDRFNDGTTLKRLQFLSCFGGWIYSIDEKIIDKLEPIDKH